VKELNEEIPSQLLFNLFRVAQSLSYFLDELPALVGRLFDQFPLWNDSTLYAWVQHGFNSQLALSVQVKHPVIISVRSFDLFWFLLHFL